MMVQNAAFIPDAIPAPAARGGMANAAAAPGAGVFQQLLQGKSSPEAPAQQGPAAQRPAAAKPRSTASQQKAEDKSQPAQAAPTEKGGAGKGKVQRHEHPVKDAAQEQGRAAAKETAPETDKAGAAQNAGAGEPTPEKTTADTVAQESAATQQSKPEPNPGLVVAMAAVESAVAARSEGSGSEAGATAVQKLEEVQQRLAQQAAVQPDADANAKQPEPQQQAVQQQNQPTESTAGVTFSQKAEPAQLPRQERAEAAPPTGATEGAQVEKAQVPPAQGRASQQQGPVLPDAAKTAVAADQSVAAAHLTAKESGAGRFVAMPVRNLTADQAQPLAGADAAVTATVQESALAQEVAATIPVPTEPAAVAGNGAAPVEAKAETAVQGKAVQQDVKETVQPEQEAAPGAVSGKEAGQAAEPQHREVRAVDGAHGREVREAVQAQQVNPGRPIAEEVSGTKGATAASATVLSAEKTVQEGQGAQGGQGEPQQKGAENQNAQMLGAGVTGQANQAESAQAETRQAAKSPLHESILSQVREGVVTHDGKGNGRMSIRLNPGELGELKIQVSMENNKLNVQVHADNNEVKNLLLSNLDSLKEALSGKNLSMDGFNVSTGGGAFDGPLNEEKGNQRQQQGSRFARNAGYDGQEAPKVNYLTAEVNSLLDVRF